MKFKWVRKEVVYTLSDSITVQDTRTLEYSYRINSTNKISRVTVNPNPLGGLNLASKEVR